MRQVAHMKVVVPVLNIPLIVKEVEPMDVLICHGLNTAVQLQRERWDVMDDVKLEGATSRPVLLHHPEHDQMNKYCLF